jgi:hypothetical protein
MLVEDADGGRWLWEATTGGYLTNNLAYPNSIQCQDSARRLLVYLNTITKIELILATPPETPTMIVLNDYREYLQAYGSIIIAFHSEVFRVLLFMFSQRRARYKESSMDMIKITYLHSGP